MEHKYPHTLGSIQEVHPHSSYLVLKPTSHQFFNLLSATPPYNPAKSLDSADKVAQIVHSLHVSFS